MLSVARSPLVASAFALGIALAGCGGTEEDDCASGVRADGVCLQAKQGGAGSSSGPTGRMPGASCTASDVLLCGHVEQGKEDTLLLSCVAGTYESKGACPAMGSCSATLPGKTSVHCDLGGTPLPVAIEGTPCVEATAACTLDQTKLLGCKDGVWTTVKACASGTACQHTDAGTSGPGWSCPASGPCAVCK